MLGRLRRLVPFGTVAGAFGAVDKADVPEEAARPVTVLVFFARLAARGRRRRRRRRRRRGPLDVPQLELVEEAAVAGAGRADDVRALGEKAVLHRHAKVPRELRELERADLVVRQFLVEPVRAARVEPEVGAVVRELGASERVHAEVSVSV